MIPVLGHDMAVFILAQDPLLQHFIYLIGDLHPVVPRQGVVQRMLPILGYPL